MYESKRLRDSNQQRPEQKLNQKGPWFPGGQCCLKGIVVHHGGNEKPHEKQVNRFSQFYSFMLKQFS